MLIEYIEIIDFGLINQCLSLVLSVKACQPTVLFVVMHWFCFFALESAMKPVKILKALLLLLFIIFPSLGGADDTEVFLINGSVAQQRPNVLIILDNTANWNQQFTWEKAALQSVVNGLTDSFNVGLMLFTESGNGNKGQDGGYMRYAIRQMTDDNKSQLSQLVNNLDILLDKSNGGKSNYAMNEAWRYYTGLSAFSGGRPNDGTNGKAKSDDGSVFGGTGAFAGTSNVYSSPKAGGCQNNFIIYISNGPAQDNSNDTMDALMRLVGYGGNTTEIPIDPNGSQWNMTDEFARFFATNSSTTGIANIITYTIDVLPGTTGQSPGWTANLKSMAQQGKGKYFVGTDSASLTSALQSVFSEVMAVNSVFSSSTLPVNVSVRGTYLNQVYMAVFRPDAHLSPRWTGNLKQYKLGYNQTTDATYLVDKNGLAAENAISGFITPLATSVWTTSSAFWDANYYLDAQGPSTTPTSDSPDGAFVEKGGAAQHERVDFTYTGSQPVRNLYTCTGSCSSGSSLSTFAFASSNTDVTASALGILTNTVGVTLSRNGTRVVTATASGGHLFVTGDQITIAGATQAEYNGTFPITKVSSTVFTYSIATENPPGNATASSTGMQATLSGNRGTVTSISRSGTTATVTGTSITNGGSTAWTGTIYIRGTGYPDYEGPHTVTIPKTSTVSSWTFTTTTRTVAETPTAPTSFGASTPGNPVAGCTSYVNSAMTRAAGSSDVTVTLPLASNKPTTPEYCFPVGSLLTVTGAVPSDYNVTQYVIKSRTINACNGASGNPKPQCINTLVYTLASGVVVPSFTSPPTSTTYSGGTAVFYISPVTVNSITRTATSTDNTNTATATVTTSSNHGFLNGYNVCVNGASEIQYNICYSIIYNPPTHSPNQFSYKIAVAPSSPGLGTITATNPLLSTLTSPQLVNWVRGQNNQLNDNPSLASTAVRGYHHGDVLHSRPAVINYNRTGQPTGRDIVAYYGANDGIFHAVKGGDNDADGDEKWGFILPEHFTSLQRLYNVSPLISEDIPKPYFVDGSIGFYTKDANNDGQLTASGSNDKAYVYLSMRRGGRFYYALDVTDPDVPKLLWKKTNTSTGYGELGLTWSEPKPASIRYQNNAVVVFGLGYDATANDPDTPTAATMGRGLMVADAATGSPIWQAGPNPTGATFNLTVSGMTKSISADPIVLDTNSDGYADRVYVADVGGNVWRANIHDSDPDHWTVYKVASIGGTGVNNRKFLYPPDVVYGSGYDAVLIGSGDREHPGNIAVLNRFYMFKDNHSLNATGPLFPSAHINTYITEADLYNATANLIQSETSSQVSAAVSGLSNASGWYVSLVKLNRDGNYEAIGEKVVGGSVSVGGATYFATNVPQISLGSTNACSSNLGESRLYALNFQTGSAILNLDQTVTSTGSDVTSTGSAVLTTSDRYMVQPGGGYAPSPVAAVVVLNGAPREAVIIGTSVMQTPRQDLNRRHSIYWGKKID